LIALRLYRAFARVLGSLAYHAGIRRDVTDSNLRLALPHLSQAERDRVALGSYHNIAIVFLEFLYLRFASRRTLERSFTIRQAELARRSASEDRGVLLVSGHIANWEWAGIGLGLSLPQPVRLIVKNQRSNTADRFLQAMRSRFGNTKVDAGDVRGIFAALKRGELLGVLGDQAAPAGSIRVPFFGISVPTFEGIARLALNTQATILFMHSARTPTGYACEFERIDYSDIDPDSADAIRSLTLRHTRILEQSILRDPSLWVWQHKRWKDAER
jgi:KDO2-lipid IV(A) lauroyltransferase